MKVNAKTRLWAVLLVVGIVATGLVAVSAQASAGKDPTRAVGKPASAKAVGTQVTSGLTTVTYSFSTAKNEINGFFNQGWWSTGETNSNDNTNYFTGTYAPLSETDRGYATFDVSGVTNPCVPSSAYLSVPTGGGAGPSTLTLGLFDVLTDPWTLSAKVNNPNTTIYTDLGTGTMYGGPYTLSTSASGTFYLYLNTAGLNALAQAHLNHQQYLSFGMGLINPPAGTAYLFGFTGGSPITMTATYPKVCKVYP